MEQLEILVDSAVVQREEPKSHSSNSSQLTNNLREPKSHSSNSSQLTNNLRESKSHSSNSSQPTNNLSTPECSVRVNEPNSTSVPTRNPAETSRNSTSSATKESRTTEAEISTMENRQQPQQQQQKQQQQSQKQVEEQQRSERSEKDDSSLLMFTSCGQLLLGVVLVVFGVLALVHGASLGGSGAGLWAGAGALVAGALGVVATLASPSGFSTAHLATSLVALALSNMAAITALTAVVRDSQRTPELTLLEVPGESAEIEGGWSGLLASVGLLVASVAELLVSGYSCLTLTPKLCGCLRPNTGSQGGEESGNGRLKTRNLVQQWVIAQNRLPKTQPVYLVQPVMQVHPIVQPAYGPGKFPPGGYMPTVPLPGYGPLPPMLPSGHPYAIRPPSQMVIRKQKRHVTSEPIGSLDRRKQPEVRPEPVRRKTLSEPEVDLARTYTGLDKKISEEFISIAMDPDRKSKASSSHGSEIGLSKNS